MKTESESVKRRVWLGSVAAVGAAVAGTMALARRNPMAGAAMKAEAPVPDSSPNSGYQLTEHVKQYYATARI